MLALLRPARENMLCREGEGLGVERLRGTVVQADGEPMRAVPAFPSTRATTQGVSSMTT